MNIIGTKHDGSLLKLLLAANGRPKVRIMIRKIIKNNNVNKHNSDKNKIELKKKNKKKKIKIKKKIKKSLKHNPITQY